jgi:hypothetical protein
MKTAFIYRSTNTGKLVLSDWYSDKDKFLKASEIVRDPAFEPVPCKTFGEVERNFRRLNGKAHCSGS